MSSKRIDHTLVLLGVVLILISSYQLFLRRDLFSIGPAMGTLSSITSVVKTKNALSLDWKDAFSGIDLTENQLIYTDTNSSAEVQFLSGDSLKISESSLIRLTSTKESHGLSVEKGLISAKLAGNEPLIIEMNGQEYRLSGEKADVQIQLNGASGEIGVLSGEVLVEKSGLKEQLNASSALVINDQESSKVAVNFELISPKRGEIIYSDSKFTQVSFSWSPETDVDLSINGAVEKVKKGFIKNLSPGVYNWKVAQAAGTSVSSNFKIIQEFAPKILRPLNGEKIDLLADEKGEAQILLQWQGSRGVRYLVEWQDSELHELVVDASSVLINISEVGLFQWRVKIHDEKRPQAIWSDWQKIQTQLLSLPNIPANLTPHEVEYQKFDQTPEMVQMRWSNTSSVEREVILPDGSVQMEELNNFESEFKAQSPGLYKWRLRGVDSYGRVSEWSEWQNFSLTDLSAELSQKGIQRIQLKKPEQAVSFSWKAPKGTNSVFELSDSQNFENLIHKEELAGDSLKVRIPKIGSYYWRSRQFLPDGTVDVSEPKRVIIEPTAAPLKPEKLPSLEVPLEDMPIKSSWLKKVFDFVLSSAHAEDARGVARITIPSKVEAKLYVVKIFRDPTLKDLIYETQTTDKNFIWTGAEPGTYYWQYAVVDFWERQSLFSDPSKLTLVGSVSLAPEKPKLLSPIRAVELESDDTVFRWTPSEKNSHYLIEISDSDDFKNILLSAETKNTLQLFEVKNLKSQMHFWRIHAYNKKNLSVLSNTGRFILKSKTPELSPDENQVWKKEWRSRAFLAWAPSMDSYTFKDGETGQIDGTTMMGLLLSGSIFKENYILSAELLHQTGEVFEGEKYLFQRLLIDATYSWELNPNHKIAAGMALGQSSGQSYLIASDNSVSSSSTSGLSYGPALKSFLSLNQNWEIQSRAFYLLGEIQQIELAADVIKKHGKFLWLGGVSYASRDYETSSGKQTSMKVSLGIGKEF